jgi:hypothetical protein
MDHRRTLLTFIIAFWCSAIIANAQSLPGKYSTTWAGNTFSGNPDWVQGYMYSVAISPEGKVYTISHWDEAHKECGIYQDGKAIGRINTTGFSITGNSSNVFAASGTSVKKYNFDGTATAQTINAGINPTYMAVNENYLVASENSSNSVVLLNLTNGSLVKRWTVKDPGAVAIDSSNQVWVVSGVKLPEDRFERKWLVYDTLYRPRIYHYNLMGEKQADSIFMYDEWKPVCLSIDKNTNQLMVGDDGPKHQVNFFEIGQSPSLVKSFGTEGGISAGEPGIITPTKFWALKGIGTDVAGNIYVVLSEDGSAIRSLKPDGQLNWELNAANFVDVMNFDPYSDGRFLYGKNEIVEMDYSKSEAGTEWSMLAYTQDRTKNPSDPRNFYTGLGHEFTSTWPRVIEGDMYLFAAGMYGIKPYVFKFSGKVASLAANLNLNGSIAFFQDKQGSFWEAVGNQIIKTPLVAIENNGDLIYGKAEKVATIPSPFSSVSRIIIDEENDVMFLTGSGNQIARYDNWSKGNRVPSFKAVLDETYNQSVALSGDYIFTCGVQTKSRVKVYSALDFTYLGMLEAGNEVGGAENTGWVDVPYGLNAIKRTNGEYIIAVEDDYKGKSVVFRWCPNGNCKQDPPTVKFVGLANKTSILPDESLEFTVNAEDKNGTIDSVQVFADSVLIATSKAGAFTYNWQNIPEGDYYLLAKAFDNDGLSATTYPVRIYVANPDITKPSAPMGLESKNITTTYATLSWQESTDDKGVAGYKIVRDGKIEYVSGGTDASFITTGLSPETTYTFSVIAFDKALNLSDTSETISVTTLSDGPFLNNPLPIPGTVELEHYDHGGEGISYHDVDAHIGGTYRDDENVDISTTSNGYYVGWIEKEEWLRYTVDVEKEGDYDIFIVTAGGAGSVNLSFSNGEKTYKVDYGSTGDWGIWKTSAKPNVHLMPGIQYLKIKMNDQQVSIDQVKIIEHETINPQVPIDLKLDTIKLESVYISWKMTKNENNIKEYKVYMDGVFVKSSLVKTYTSKKLTPGQTYNFEVSSVSLVGNESVKSNVLTVTIPDKTSIKNQRLEDNILIYPSPAKQHIFVEANGIKGSSTIIISDISGRAVRSEEIIISKNSPVKIDVTSLKSGIYFVEVCCKDRKFNSRFIINR